MMLKNILLNIYRKRSLENQNVNEKLTLVLSAFIIVKLTIVEKNWRTRRHSPKLIMNEIVNEIWKN